MRTGGNDEMRMRAAAGYTELGMFAEAEEELKGLTEDGLAKEEVLMIRHHMAHERQQWNEARQYAEMLYHKHPDNGDWAVKLAYATRRAASIQEARKILTAAVARFPGMAVIHFNLACYACQLGDLPDARQHLGRALAIDQAFYEEACKDSDLAPLWGELADGCWPVAIV
jgi:predicted Zn-dependent protease